MTKDKTYWIDRGWQPVFVGFCPSEKAWDRTMKDFKIIAPYEKVTGGRCTHLVNATSGDEVILVTVMDNTEEKFSALAMCGIFAHEASHVFDFICESIGEDHPSKEFKAYSLQAITQELLNAYDKTRCNGELFK